MEILRTPDHCFDDLPGYPFAPHYTELDDDEGGTLRVHHVDEGAADRPPVLMMHGEPTWSYLYRKMIPPVVEAGYRAVAPDLVGFGKSDKPAHVEDYTYQRHVDWMTQWLEAVDLADITLVAQDWGGLIGLRLVADQPERFSRIVVANTFLPTGDQDPGKGFLRWQQFAREVPELPVGRIVDMGCVSDLGEEVIAAYDAPFPTELYKAGARIFPELVPTRPDDPASPANRAAWERLESWTRPLLTAFSDNDVILGRAFGPFQKQIPGAQGQPHTTIQGAGHFVQEDKGEDLARVVIDFIRAT